jgi:hypothetical protein
MDMPLGAEHGIAVQIGVDRNGTRADGPCAANTTDIVSDVGELPAGLI